LLGTKANSSNLTGQRSSGNATSHHVRKLTKSSHRGTNRLPKLIARLRSGVQVHNKTGEVHNKTGQVRKQTGQARNKAGQVHHTAGDRSAVRDFASKSSNQSPSVTRDARRTR
jgi:hypothetical protein